jgi:zinc-binding alcohol dehydrogenase family protein
MKAVGQIIYGGPEVLQFMDVPQPTLRAGDLLVRVHAFAINPVDTQWRRGDQLGMPVDNPPQIVGWDAAGVVTKTDARATHFKVGDEVYFAGDSTRQGCYAEYAAVDERIVAYKPQKLSFAEAAAVPLTALTAWEAFFENMGISLKPSVPAHTLLIVGGAGGVGSMAIQIAKRVAGLYVIATASRTASSEYCKKMGADAVIDHTQNLEPQLKALGVDGVDYILNAATSPKFPQLVKILNPLGKICTITRDDDALKTLDVNELFSKRVTLTFELMFTRPRLSIEPEKQGQILAQIAELLDQQVLINTLTQVMDWHEIQRAHQLIESGHTLGKIVLNVTA